MEYWVQLNGDLAEKWEDMNIVEMKDSMPGHADWANKPIGEKIDLLEIE